MAIFTLEISDAGTGGGHGGYGRPTEPKLLRRGAAAPHAGVTEPE